MRTLRRPIAALAASLAVSAALHAQDPAPPGALHEGAWRAVLRLAGGELPFGLELRRDEGAWRAVIVNGPERIAVDDLRVTGTAVVIGFPHYASRIEARVDGEGRRLTGTWTKASGSGETALGFDAVAVEAPRFPREHVPEGSVAGRWRMQLAESGEAVLVLTQDDAGTVHGTVETPTGDWRHLAGSLDAARLRLSVFDGAHAFLLDARRDLEGVLHGEFWSGASAHEAWTAVRDDDAALPDAFTQTRFLPRVALADIVLPLVEPAVGGPPARALSLGDAALAGRARLLVLFGTWCPNCHDEAATLRRWHERFQARGLAITGLAFEIGDDPVQQAEQLRRFATRHGVAWPLLLAGTADKRSAGASVPLLDRVRAFPTTILLAADGSPRAVHSGWSGPATGEAHERLVAGFTQAIERTLEEPVADRFAELRAVEDHATLWHEHGTFAGGDLAFEIDPPRSAVARHRVFGSGRPVIRDVTGNASLLGETLCVGERVLVFDREAGVLRDPLDWGRRFTPHRDRPAPFAGEDPAQWRRMLDSAATLERREAITALAALRGAAMGAPAPLDEVLPLLRDPDPLVLRAAIWAAGRCHERRAIPTLIELTAHADAGIRREAVRALVRMGREDERAERAVLARRADPDPTTAELARDAPFPRGGR
ncbi:MAG: HEAT repeat domain-containing protein [Planctomycetes bacterium]|nr:HEAT repeat domain-containing protein [Planctomycetota bacterium]